jgi:competence ComEA-like helix-hairpin-helix protein
MKPRFFTLVGILLLLAIASGAAPLTGVKFVVDPGHGGQVGQTYNGISGDPGACGLNGLREADCVLTIGKRVRDLLQAQGATVYMTRDQDAALSLGGRTTMANNLAVDRFVSIHQNANSNRTPNYTGSHVYTSASQNSIDMAAKTVVELDAYHKIGVVSSNFGVRGVRQDNFYVIRETNMPAQLVENSFISNVAEEDRLRNVAHLNAAADAIFKGVMTHLGKTVTSDATPPTISHTAVTQANEGTALAISATITDASGVRSAKLFYRARGAAVWTSTAMAKGTGEIWTATIPASVVTSVGVDYYIEALDNVGSTGNLGRLPSGAPVAPFGVAVAALPKTGVLTGVISDQATGVKLAGVAVALSPGGQKVFTSSTGLYRFENLSPGQYTASATHSGYQPNASARTVEAGSTWWNSFALAVAPPSLKAGDVVINELMWDQLEYIELYNNTNRDIPIAGWRIHAGSGTDADKVQVIVDANAVIKARGYYIAADKGALNGITVDEIDAQTWAQTSQVVTLWTGKPGAVGIMAMDRAGKFGGDWFGGINDRVGVAMERKNPTASGLVASSWQTSSGNVGGRSGTAGAGNSAGRVVTAAIRQVGATLLAALPTTQGMVGQIHVAAVGAPQGIASIVMPLLVAAGTYSADPDALVIITGPTRVSAGSTHTYTATAYEGQDVIGSTTFNVTFGTGASDVVSRAVTATKGDGTKVTGVGRLSVAIEPTAGTIAASFNDPVTGASELDAGLASLIRNATSSVKVAIYAINARLVIDALKEAAENLGEENIQVVMEGSTYASSTYKAYAAELEAAGITIIRDDQFGGGQNLMHHKFAVLDGHTVWTGSANMTEKDAHANANNVMVLRSAEIAAAFTVEFDRMAGGDFGKSPGASSGTRVTVTPPADLVDVNRADAATLTSLPGVTSEMASAIVAERAKNGPFRSVEDILAVPGIDASVFNAIRSRLAIDPVTTPFDLEVLFSPNGGTEERIIAAIDGAEKEVAFAVFTFTSPGIAEALKRAEARGVKVRGVADAWQALSEYSAVSGLREAGLAVKKDGLKGLMHNKFLIVDPGAEKGLVVTGSANWTTSASNFNNETLLVLHSPQMAGQYLASFEELFAGGR